MDDELMSKKYRSQLSPVGNFPGKERQIYEIFILFLVILPVGNSKLQRIDDVDLQSQFPKIDCQYRQLISQCDTWIVWLVREIVTINILSCAIVRSIYVLSIKWLKSDK